MIMNKIIQSLRLTQFAAIILLFLPSFVSADELHRELESTGKKFCFQVSANGFIEHKTSEEKEEVKADDYSVFVQTDGSSCSLTLEIDRMLDNSALFKSRICKDAKGGLHLGSAFSSRVKSKTLIKTKADENEVYGVCIKLKESLDAKNVNLTIELKNTRNEKESKQGSISVSLPLNSKD